MRKFIIAASTMALAALTISSCIKKKEESKDWMKATIATTNLSVTSVSGIELGGQMSISGYTYNGGTLGAPKIYINIRNWGTGHTGTYYVGSSVSSDSTDASYESAAGTVYESQSGTVTITALSSSELSGTFSFTCKDGTTVSNGSFRASKI